MKQKKIKAKSTVIKLRSNVKMELEAESKRTGIPQARLVEQGWELRKKMK